MKQLITYFRNLTNSESSDSSKRFLALYVTVILISFVVFAYTDKSNIGLVLGELTFFALALVGVNAWEKRNKAKYNDTTRPDETEER